MSLVLGSGESNISLNDIIPGNPQVVLWSPEEKPDFTYARKVFELVVIRKLTLLHSRGDLPSLSLWAKKMKDSTLVRSAEVIQEIYHHLESNRIDVNLLPLGWETVLAKSFELKKKMMDLDDIKSVSRKAVLSAAWEAFDYWITVQDSGLPSSPEEWWDNGPDQLVKQLEAKISFASGLNLDGLIEAAKSYSALRLAYGTTKAAKFQNLGELKSLSEESAVNLLLRLVIKGCPDILDDVLTSVNRMFMLKDNGNYNREFGLPYLYDEIGNVRSLLSPPKFGFPYNLNSKAGVERFNLHLKIRNANIDKDTDIEATNVELLPEYIKLHYILENSVEAFKFISWSEDDVEYGYMYGLKPNTLFEPVSSLWKALIFNKMGEIHPEVLSLNKCLLSSEFSALVSDLISKFESSTEGILIPSIYNIYSGDYSKLERFIIPDSPVTQVESPAEDVNDVDHTDEDVIGEQGGVFDRKLLSTSEDAVIESSSMGDMDEVQSPVVTNTTTSTSTPVSPATPSSEGSPSSLTESPLIDTPESTSEDASTTPLSPLDDGLGMSVSPSAELCHPGVKEDSVLCLVHSPRENDSD